MASGTETIRPNDDVGTNNWDNKVSAEYYMDVDESTPDSSSISSATNGQTVEFEMGNITASDFQEATRIDLYVYGEAGPDGGSANEKVSINDGSDWLDMTYVSGTFAFGGGWEWVRWKLENINWTLSDVNNLRVRLISVIGGGKAESIAVDTVYVSVTYTTVLTQADVLDGTIVHREMTYPKAQFRLKEGTEVANDHVIKFTATYTDDDSTDSQVIFEGWIEDYSLTDIKDCSAVAKGSEVARIQPLGRFQGITGVWLSEMINTYKDYLGLSLYGPTTWSNYWDAPWNFSANSGRTGTDIDWVDDDANGTCSITAEVDDGDAAAGSVHAMCLTMTWTASSDATKHNFSAGAQASGTMEFWFLDSDVSDRFRIKIQNEDTLILQLYTGSDGSLYYSNNLTNTDSGTNLADDTWYRLRITWNGDNTWDWILWGADGTQIDTATGQGTWNDNINPNNIKWDNYLGGSHIIYIDAYGESWEDSYTIGDNASEIAYNLPSTDNRSSKGMTGGDTLESQLSEGAQFEGDVWALTPEGEIIWTDGSTQLNSITFDGTQNVWDVSANKQLKRVNRVVLHGAGGLQSIANDTDRQTSSGNIIIYKDYRADITNQSELDTLATAILNKQKNPPLRVQMSVDWSAKGFLQPGYNVTINANSIKYNESSSYVTAGDYRVQAITYHIKNGAYEYIELDLVDGVHYTQQTDTENIQQNTTNADQSYGGTTVSSGAGGGSGISNIVEDTTPQLGGDLDCNEWDILNAEILKFNTGGDLTIDTEGDDELLIKTNGTERIGINSSGVIFGNANARITTVLDEDAMGSNSATALATQQSIKAYVDSGPPSHTHDGETLQADAITSDGASFVITASNNISIKANGDADDYIQIIASGNEPFIKAIGTGALNLTTDGGAINLKASNDTDDYIQVVTTSNVPKIQTVGAIGELDNFVMLINPQPASAAYEGLVLEIDTTGASTYDCVYIDGDQSATTADADGTTFMPSIGIVVAANKVLINGTIANSAWTWTAGQVLYVHTDGTLTATVPSGSGDVVQVMGIALGDDEVLIMPSLDWVEIA